MATIFPNDSLRGAINGVVKVYSNVYILASRLLNYILSQWGENDECNVKDLIKESVRSIVDAKAFVVNDREYDPRTIFGMQCPVRIKYTSNIITNMANQLEVTLRNHVNTNVANRVYGYFIQKIHEIKGVNRVDGKSLARTITTSLKHRDFGTKVDDVVKMAKKRKLSALVVDKLARLYNAFVQTYQTVLPLRVGYI